MSTVSIRYIVDDVDEAQAFYVRHLGFRLDMHPNSVFAMLSRGDLRLVLVSPVGPDHPGGVPTDARRHGTDTRWVEPIMLQVPDVDVAAETCGVTASVPFRRHLGGGDQAGDD